VYLAQGDAFLLCTDGLWNCTSNQDILEILQVAASAQEWVEKLEWHVKNINANNQDNYTIIGIWITSSVDRTVLMD
jgi:serine/threonine protein phosphatase PrpC